jgi:predicted nucleic acid-binding protein
VRFWDSSAVAPLVVEEPRSRACRELRRGDPEIVVWSLTRTEVISTLRRLERRRQLTLRETNVALARFDKVLATFAQVVLFEAVRDRADRVLAAHDLTAADALQLAAALVFVAERPKRRGFVTADERLADAARGEGFDVLIPHER